MQEEHMKGPSLSPLSHLWYFSFWAKEMMPATQGKSKDQEIQNRVL